MSAFPTWLFTDAPSWALPLVLKSTVVLTAAAVVAFSLRRASAAARHMVWALAFGALAALPLLSILLPRWKIEVLPAPPGAPARAATDRC